MEEGSTWVKTSYSATLYTSNIKRIALENKVPILDVEKPAINRLRMATGCLVWLEFKTILLKQMEIIRRRKTSCSNQLL